jgi:nitroreductase
MTMATTRPPRDLFLAALPFALLAPSIRNTQPWRFEIRDDELWLWADRSRALPVADPEHRELVMSCGAALFNVRTALQHLGRNVQVKLAPDARRPDLLARIALTPGVPGREDYAGLVAAMRERRTHREPFGPDAVPEELLELFRGIAAREGAWLAVLRGPRASEAAFLVGSASRRQLRSSAYRRELGDWPHEAGVGGSLKRLVRRWWDHGRLEAADEERLARTAPALIALGTGGDAVRHWLSAGQALQHILLVATNAGLSASFLNHPVQLPEFRRWLLETAGLSGAPQLLLRMGYATEARPATDRRPLMEVVQVS